MKISFMCTFKETFSLNVHNSRLDSACRRYGTVVCSWKKHRKVVNSWHCPFYSLDGFFLLWSLLMLLGESRSANIITNTDPCPLSASKKSYFPLPWDILFTHTFAFIFLPYSLRFLLILLLFLFLSPFFSAPFSYFFPQMTSADILCFPIYIYVRVLYCCLQKGKKLLHWCNRKAYLPGIHGEGAVSFRTVGDFSQKIFQSSRWYNLHKPLIVQDNFPWISTEI